ncbi:hypothetical protein GCM10009828_074730 [Actinoplanes couchii]|uniref:HNH domain-containing protein n=1 Tax=Actinoplanes couchii TaxID=403638 RepID=A0ABQ3X043_9ACTN|nr:hypothetical protein Aco03nite_002220 [Actinoplanes couchii]
MPLAVANSDGAHQVLADGSPMSTWTQRNGSTSAWRRVRAEVLARDAGRGCRAYRDGWCARPGVKQHVCTGQQQAVHHTLGLRAGDDPRYLVASCTACNTAIGDPSRSGDPPGTGSTRW